MSVKSKTGEFINDLSKYLQCLVKHYLELYSIQNFVSDAALDALPGRPVMEELNTMPRLEGLSKAIDCLACQGPRERCYSLQWT